MLNTSEITCNGCISKAKLSLLVEAGNEKELALPYTPIPAKYPKHLSQSTVQILLQLYNLILSSEHQYVASSVDNGWLMRQFFNQLRESL